MSENAKPWQVLARRTIYDSEWVGLQHVDVRLPDGKIIHNMHVVTYPRPAAAVVPIRADGKILLIDHYRFQTDTRGWEIPAGRIDAGETPEQAAMREMREESGHFSESLKYLGRYHPSNGSGDQVFHVFVARDVERVGEIEDTNEVMGLQWFLPHQVRELIARNEILDGLSLTALCWSVTQGEI
jgi:8-oxo-dGTP pyrophosphatase MutT (NUDIX family)